MRGLRGRVFLDSVYLEIREPQEPLKTAGSVWFLRPTDIHACAAQVRAHGLRAHGPSKYEASDGTWLDVELEAGDLGAVLPVMTRRVSPAGDPWPPPPTERQPNGTYAVREVQLTTPDPCALRRVLLTLGANVGEDMCLTYKPDVRIVIRPGVSGIASVAFATDGPDDVRLDL